MQSSAGSTRRRRYLLPLAAGTLLSILAVLASLWATYHSSPRMLAEEPFEAGVRGEYRVTLDLPGATGSRIYYSVDASSSAPASFTLVVVGGGSSRELQLGEGVSVRRQGSLLLEEAPSAAQLVIRCGECVVRGALSIRYYSVDFGLLLALDALSVAFSVAGLALLAYGAHGYAAAARAERRVGVTRRA